MKKIIVSLAGIFILTAITFVSCKKNEVKVDDSVTKTTFNGNNPNAHEMRLELISFSKDIQKMLFNTLKPEQKNALWQDKLDQVINKNSFSDYQIELLKSLKKNITTGVYVVGGNEEINFKNNFHQEWIKKAKGQFIFDELVKIVATLDDFNQGKGMISGGPGVGRVDDCECSLKSDWCVMSMTCKIDDCLDSAHGCGTAWTYACKGMCKW